MFRLNLRTWSFVLAAALALPGCIQFGPFLEGGEASIAGDGGALPVRWAGKFAIVDVSLDGAAPRPFLLDTGANVLAVTPGLAAEIAKARGAEAVESDEIEIAGADGSVGTAVAIVRIGELRCGPLTVRGIDALVIDLDLPQAALGAPFDGILPGGAVGEALLTLDYPERVVAVSRGELPAGAPDVLETGSGWVPVVSLDVGGRSEAFLVDTGGGAFLSVPASAEGRLSFKAKPVQTGNSATIGGAVASRDARLDGTFAFASHRLADPILTISPVDQGRIGADLLREFRVTIDRAHERIRFERASAEPILSPPVRTAGVGMLRRGDAWTVHYLLDGTPATTSGLKQGDRIVSVDGRPVAELQPTDFRDPPSVATSVRFGVADGAAVREVVVPIVTLVE